MTLCKVIGTLVATQKNDHLKNQKMLIVQPIDLEGKLIGRDLIALDSVDAGVGDTVLVNQEGQGAAQVLKDKKAPVHSVIVAVVDGMEIKE
ncbi:MAG: EutN/CcmL family microcompartment protein [Ignavibacteriales bacterium]|nr:EutN/CcmL family microcompartment protein [Ignavibacteriales bacterium]